MIRDREEYTTPVGFAREPAAEVRRWIGRIMLGIVVLLLGYILLNNVVSPDDNEQPRNPLQSELPAPV